MKRLIKNNYVITTFFFSILYITYLNIMKIYPFGEYSILKCDLYQQYVNFFCYLKEVVLNGKSIFISWNLGLANNFYTTFAYYLISPLNLLVVFFDYSNMDIFVEIITFLKIALMANFMTLYLKKSYKYQNKEVILFGIIYAFSSYVICYSFHIMWLDCLYMLPIVVMYIDKYLENEKIWPFVVSLGYAILTNYYIGYIVALFSGSYYLAKSYILKKKKKAFIKFSIGMLLAIGIGMIVIYPSIMQLKGKMNATTKLIEVDIEKIRLFVNVLFNNYVYMFTQKSCFMFSSTLVLLLLPMYYFNKNISKREKISFSAIIIFLLLPIISPLFSKLWHAFTTPNCFNYRHSFTILFMMILMSARTMQNKEHITKWHFLISIMVFTILTLIEIIFLKKGYLESDNYTVTINSIVVSSLVYITMLILTYLVFYYPKKLFYICLSITVGVDLCIGARSGQNNNDKYFKRGIVTQYDEFMSYFIPKLEVPETERIVFEPDKYGSNMSLKYGYSNIGFFTSARNRDILKSMYRLGYNVQMDEQLWITSFSGTFLNYSIAGVKYYITKEKIDFYGFELEEKYKDFYIYKNKNNFGIGYYLSNNIEESYNPFKMQNDLLNNLSKNENKREYFENIENTECLSVTKDVKYNDSEYILKYTVKAKKDCSIYLASDNNLQLYINNEPQFENYSNIWSYETGIKQVKNLKAGESFDFNIETKQNLDLLYIYVSNNEYIQNAVNNKKELQNVVIRKKRTFRKN